MDWFYAHTKSVTFHNDEVFDSKYLKRIFNEYFINIFFRKLLLPYFLEYEKIYDVTVLREIKISKRGVTTYQYKVISLKPDEKDKVYLYLLLVLNAKKDYIEVKASYDIKTNYSSLVLYELKGLKRHTGLSCFEKVIEYEKSLE